MSLLQGILLLQGGDDVSDELWRLVVLAAQTVGNGVTEVVCQTSFVASKRMPHALSVVMSLPVVERTQIYS